MEIKDKIELRKQILKELYISWEKWEDFIENLNVKFNNIKHLDVDLQILYMVFHRASSQKSDIWYLNMKDRIHG